MHEVTGSALWSWISVALLSWNEHNGGFWWPWMLIPLLFWGGFIALIAWAVIRLFPRRRSDDNPTASRDRAEEILRERFARGEITSEEYEKSLEVLRRAGRETGEDPRKT